MTPSLNPVYVVDGAGLEKAKQFLSSVTEFDHDYETNIVDRFFDRRIRTLQFGNKDIQFIIDFLAFAETLENLHAGQGWYGATSHKLGHCIDPKAKAKIQPIIDVIKGPFQSNSHLKIGANLEFEYIVSKWCLGLRPWNYYCVKIAEHILVNGRVMYDMADYFGLDDMVARYFGVQIDKTLQKNDWMHEGPLTDLEIIYTALDCRLPSGVRSKQLPQLRQGKLEEITEIEMNWIPVVGDRHLNGVLNDNAGWSAIEQKNIEEQYEIVARMDKLLIPVVGSKVAPPSEEEVEQLYKEWKALDEKSEAEQELSARIRKVKTSGEDKEQLKAERTALEEQRKVAKAAAKAAHQAKATLLTKKGLEKYNSYQGEAQLNYNSTDQLHAALLKGNFGITEKKLPNTDDETLEKLAHIPVIKELRQYRAVKKSIGTYGSRWTMLRTEEWKKGKFGYIDPDTGRIHYRIKQIGADTGRESATGPNLYNTPKKGGYRECFMARAGHKNVGQDCSGQELRIAADYSQDPVWMDAFKNGKDPHSMDAALMFPEVWAAGTIHNEVEMVIDGKAVLIPKCAFVYNDMKKCKCPAHLEKRDKNKPVNFGIIYGKTKYAVAIDLDCTPDEAEEFLQGHHGIHGPLWGWIEQAGDYAVHRGEARTRAMRRRWLDKIDHRRAYKSAKKKLEERMKKDELFAERNKGRTEPTQDEIQRAYMALTAKLRRDGANTPVQGTGADLMKLAGGAGFDENGKPYLWHVAEPDYGARLWLFCYDEFQSEVPYDPDGDDITPFYNGTHPIDDELPQKYFEATRDAIIRAGAALVKTVPMESEGQISDRYCK